MKAAFRYWILVLGIALSAGSASATHSRIARDSFTVYFFLLEDCMISQAYPDVMQDLFARFANDSIAFRGSFPNPLSRDSSVSAFLQKYEITFPCLIAGSYNLAVQFGVTVTPEVVIYNHSRAEKVYQGRIDNMFERVGKRRRVVTSHELRDALESIHAGLPVPIPRTEAIGCLLN